MSLGLIVSDLQRNDSSFCVGCRHKHHVLLSDKTHKLPNQYPRQSCSAIFFFQHNLCRKNIEVEYVAAICNSFVADLCNCILHV